MRAYGGGQAEETSVFNALAAASPAHLHPNILSLLYQPEF